MNNNRTLLKRTLLTLLSVLAVFFMASTLISSWQNPQEQTRLDLLQTDLILQSSQLAANEPLRPVAELLVGTVEPDPAKTPDLNDVSENIYAAALSHYQQTRQVNQASQDRLVAALRDENDHLTNPQNPRNNAANGSEANNSGVDNSRISSLNKEIFKKQQLIRELDLRIGLLQVATGQVSAATKTWQDLAAQADQLSLNQRHTTSLTAEILAGLWQEPPRIYPQSEKLIKINLDGWYQTKALTRFYQGVQRPDLIPAVTTKAQSQALDATMRLLAVVSVPLAGGLLGVILWLVLLVQWLIKRSASPLTFSPDTLNLNPSEVTEPNPSPENSAPENQPQNMAIVAPVGATNIIRQQWVVLWDGETVWQVMVLWFTAFVLMSELVLPLGLLVLGIRVKQGDNYTVQALFVLIPYLLAVSPMLPLIWGSLRQHWPLPEPWLRLYPRRWQWILWGIGGYLAAVPLVLLVSTLSQTWLNGQGGGNPLLPILVDSRAGIAKLLLWLTLGVAAPFFEEYLFRGFLLPSLVRFMPVWAALGLSGFGFALAHLNLADLLPLTTLGIILGFVYIRSRNLLAPMLMHCLWNSGSFIALIALGGN